MDLSIEKKNSNRITYLDGLRGIAMSIVILNHFAAAFYPAIVFGDKAHSHNALELLIYKTPLNVFFSGIFAVCLFFILSGYFLSYKYFKFSEKQPLTPTMIRRYLALAIPTLFSTLIAYFILKNHWFYNLSASSITGSDMWFANFWRFNANIFSAIVEGVFMTSIFIGNKTYNPVLWMMGYELVGSFLVYIILGLFNFSKKRIFIYSILFILTFAWKSYLIGFALGIFICDLEFNFKLNFLKHESKILGSILFISAIILASYPIESIKGTIFEFISIPILSNTKNIVLFQMIASCLLLFAIKKHKILQTILDFSVLRFLGKISFSVFFLHLLVIGSFSSFLFKILNNYLNYNISVLITLLFSLPIILILAFYFHKYIVTNSLNFANYIRNYIISK